METLTRGNTVDGNDRVRAIAFDNAGDGVMSSRRPTERANVRELGAYP
jgi:hypothetical protein